ncbi:hypothetical protein FDK38_004412 [Candidozyma auris]|nr:hypothetical protein FDK38_004412 [[Candida] auris]
MGDQQRINRKDLYDQESEIDEDPIVLPNIEFELIDVASEEKTTNGSNAAEEPEEFAFPLFSAPRSEVMTVTMREEELDEDINNERPESYYRAIYSRSQKEEFAFAAVDASYVFEWSRTSFPDSAPWKVMDLRKYNETVEKERRKHRKRRPGKKKRANVIVCKERRLLREKEEKKLRREQEAREKRKRFKKWTGGPPKGKEKTPQKPKYRTE